MPMEKIICYIDGYNFYHATKDKPSANINLYSLAESLLGSGVGHKGEKQLEAVKYFSAYATWRPKDMVKHRHYVGELERVGCQVVMSHFKSKITNCWQCNKQTKTHEEKETDVRITLQIFEDAVDDKFDTAFILSGDSDIVPAIQKVRARYPEKRILVVLPKHQVKHARDMLNATHGVVNLAESRIQKHKF